MQDEFDDPIETAAFTAFAKFGFRRTTMADVAEAAQMSRPALYLRVKNKDQLLELVAARLLARSLARARAAAATEVRDQFETNVFGLTRMIQLVLPSMRAAGQGRIVNISSMGGRLTFPFGGFHHASKHAVEALSDALRFEAAPFGIRVSIIEPGLITTRALTPGRVWDRVVATTMGF
ncbi:SDR family NAD(P)-dependent oxidoreductase [Amycolatopsis sp. CA-126428]|uniref:SDR family NAD(P)-dependent oxidoreductase n=1 Tax=Amycolatopsis sp. CA-126428 TaxID=2073158 RepID=UPI000CCFFAAB|nr:SDR family NAD(P)-dependent oxidoreductase [Amycolatopsis sp. CA-126428]